MPYILNEVHYLRSFSFSVPGLRPAVSLTPFATTASCDWIVRLMQYISLFSAGGWWRSWTEIFGTLEMILNNKTGANTQTLQTSVEKRSDVVESDKWYNNFPGILALYCAWTKPYMVLCCMVKLSQSSSLRASTSRPHCRDDLLACKASWVEAASPPAPLQFRNTQRPLSLPSISSIPVS